ncbi:hypothetical protein EVAR_7806_1 [Eumeta japonica]|uniref:Uncharacterized protein n=1 Tax=Eumeta variegata TaxID=151549 RepID=A0A4C1TMC5_EUMVA|nr:hypothetical protein EVAR_7806_1 [Eumeta japonica]
MYVNALSAQCSVETKREMSRTACALLCVIFLLSLCSSGVSRKTFHSYPRSGGLSGTRHGYPRSHGLSGVGNGYIRPSYSAHLYTHQTRRHKYPLPALHRYRSPGGHRYPSPRGHHYPSPGRHHYPSPGGSSHKYPPSNGISGNNNYRGSTTNNVHHHYHYTPPLQIHYAPRGGPAYSYPVFQSQPPTYVYKYRDSSSKYGPLLAGLSLLNLGMLTASTFSHHRNRHYRSQPGEVCKLGIRKENGDYEETKINCEIISSFIWADEDRRRTSAANPGHNSTSSTVTVTMTNTTTTTANNNNSALNDVPATLYTMLPNGTLVQVNATQTNGSVTSSVTTVTTTNTTTVSDALDPKNNGPPVMVTDGTQCYLMRRTRTNNMRHTIACSLLLMYSSHISDAQKHKIDAV